jgi:hypothetical protein
VSNASPSSTVLVRSEHSDGRVCAMSDGPVRYLLVCTPGGFERRFDRLAAERAGVEPPREALRPYPPTIFVGPRIGERAH